LNLILPTLTPLQRLEAVKEAWRLGRLKYLLRAHQRRLRSAWVAARPISRKFFGCCGRGFGKSTDLFIEGLEWSQKFPETDVYFIAPVEKKLDDYLEPIRQKILAKAPPEFLYRYTESDNTFRFPNKSRMLIRGSNHKSYDDLRGGKCGLGLIDEARGVDDLEDLIDNVMMPACGKAAKENRLNGHLLVTSTPPPTTDHPLEHYFQEAEAGGYYFHSSVEETDWPADIIEEFAREAGGKTSMTWRIEYKAERGLVDNSLKIVPEFDKTVGGPNVITRAELEKIKQRPEHQFYRWFESVDIGTVDKQILIGSFYSFLDATLYIDFERVSKKGETTTHFGDDLTKLEKDRNITAKVYLRVCDTNGAQLALDLLESHKIAFYPTDKGRLVEMVNKVCVYMGAARIKIADDCTFLIGSLYNCVWKDHLKKEFARSKTYGHGDAVAALIYKVRNLVESNPIPNTFQIPTLPGTDVVPPWVLKNLPPEPSKKAFNAVEKLRAKLKSVTHGPVRL
jgi:hypothetical protein